MSNTHLIISMTQTNFNIERRFRRLLDLYAVDTITITAEAQFQMAKDDLIREAQQWLNDMSHRAVNMGLCVHTSLQPVTQFNDLYIREVFNTQAWLHFDSAADCALFKLKYPDE